MSRAGELRRRRAEEEKSIWDVSFPKSTDCLGAMLPVEGADQDLKKLCSGSKQRQRDPFPPPNNRRPGGRVRFKVGPCEVTGYWVIWVMLADSDFPMLSNAEDRRKTGLKPLV